MKIDGEMNLEIFRDKFAYKNWFKRQRLFGGPNSDVEKKNFQPGFLGQFEQTTQK